MKQRIVLVTDSLDPSGMGEHMLTLGAALNAEFDIALAAPQGDTGRALLTRAARSGLRIKAFDPGRLDLFRHWLDQIDADLVHVHAGIGWEGHGLVRAAKAAGLPVVRTEHLPYLLTSVVQQAEYRAMLLSVDRRIAVSNAVLHSHAARGGGRIHAVPNGITPKAATASRADTRAALGLADDDQVILTVARFTAQKGHDVLLAAAPAVLAAQPKAKFILVGTGPEQENIKAAIAGQGLGDKVLVLGARDDVPNLLATADLVVLPSYFEGLSLALLEAMAASVPVVATAIDGATEAVGQDYPFLAPPGNAEALSATIIRSLDDKAAAEAAADASLERFSQSFTADRMARQTSAIYRSLLPHSTLRGASA